MKQNIVCPKCGDVIEVVEKVNIKKTSIKSRTICKICREKHIDDIRTRTRSDYWRDFQSKRMKENNPMFINGKKKLPVKKMSKEEVSEFNSKRMKENNPMFNKHTAKKMANTIKQKINTGQLVYKKGKDHHLYKGGCRDFNNLCRSRLYTKWIKPIMERDNFTCTYCGKTKIYLNVHHIKPLREFIENIKIKYNIKSFNDINKENWESYVDEIVNSHKLSDGITLCKNCHSIVDSHFF